MAKPLKAPKIVFRKLGMYGKARRRGTHGRPRKRGLWGLYTPPTGNGRGLIELDPRQRPLRAMDTLIHEMLHHLFPDESEAGVEAKASLLAEVLWEQDYRRVVQ